MNMNKTLIAVLVSIALTGCGGGGGGGSTAAAPVGATPAPAVPATPSNPAPAPVPAPPAAATPVDPYTGGPAVGTPTTMVSGMVVSNVTVGATVTAYDVKADGSNGALLATSSTTGADGKFVLQFASAPTSMVRFVATGGAFKSEADATTQANTVTELVAPFVTSDLNSFVITPATHIASRVLSYKAKAGSSLVSAYTSGISAVLSLTGQNVILKGDTRVGVNMLKTVPGSAGDTLNTYEDLLTAIEWYGVRYDLPSSTVVRVFAAYAENDFPLAGVDGKGAAINVGTWVNGKFDETVPFTFDEVTALRNNNGSLAYAPNGIILHQDAKSYIGTSLIQYFYRAAACTNEAAMPALLQRYPTDATLFADAPLKAGVCDTDIKFVGELKSRIATNQRSK
jgi:hypothetical protein